MNAQPQSEIPAELTPESCEMPIRIGLAPFEAFVESLEKQLEQLVLRWQHKAAPCATRRRR
jgi:hypothetical protein